MISSRSDEKTSIFKVTNEKAERYDDIIYVTQGLKKENQRTTPTHGTESSITPDE